MIGGEISGDQLLLTVTAKSTDEFGKLESLQFWRGDLTTKSEIAEFVINNFLDPYHFQWEQKLVNLSKRSYLRAELTTQKADGQIARCLTDPIWIKF